MKNLSSKSDWNESQVEAFLNSSRIPIRIAVDDGDYPLICSVWYQYRDGALCVVSHKSSKLAKLLLARGRCAFEIAPNEPPYQGVRGKAEVSSNPENAESTLRSLIDRYLGDTNQSLAKWLLSRVDDELEFVVNSLHSPIRSSVTEIRGHLPKPSTECRD